MSDPRSTRTWRRARAAWAPVVAAGGVACRRCGAVLTPGEPWDLGHPEEAHGRAPLTPELLAACRPEHVRCNRSAGGRGNTPTAIVTAPPGVLW
ncbi:hypothetical protein AB3X52_04595 [Nocardioides sp. DS6]|uniref:HNH endonuclease n=1 Tax=Nocardioides eburneus TaxID=3231482 RepID=A0ABV3SVC8_9ACTN